MKEESFKLWKKIRNKKRLCNEIDTVIVYNPTSLVIYFSSILDKSIDTYSVLDHDGTEIPVDEIIQQIRIGNKLFLGTDGHGSCAHLFICDSQMRSDFGLDQSDYRR